MQLVEIGSFAVVHHHLPWPWIAIDASRRRLAFPSAKDLVATQLLSDGRLIDGPSFTLPADLRLPRQKAPPVGHRGVPSGVHGLSLDCHGDLLSVVGTTKGVSVVATLDTNGEVVRSPLEALAGGDFTAHATAFDRSGARLWISAESEAETALLLVDARSHAVLGVVKSAPFPPPSFHELHVHPEDDAVLLVAACGQDGTFARIAGWSDGPPLAVPTALDKGGVSAGFVGFSADSARVHFVESDELRTHAWPGLEELSSVDLADDFASSYAGAVLGDRIFIDGEDRDTGDGDAVMLFDRSGLRGRLLEPPVPTGMWVGRLGVDAIVTVESRGDPAHARVLRIPAPHN